MKRAITEVDVGRLARDGVLVVTRDMVLTPGARDYASSHQITVRYEDSPPSEAAAPIGEDELVSIIEQIVVEEITKGGSGAPAQPAADPALPGAETAQSIPESAAMDPAGRQEAAGGDFMERILAVRGDDGANRAIVTVIGRDRPGIVSRVSAVVADCGGNLEDITQVVLDKYFSMIFIVNLAGLEPKNLTFRVFKERLQDEAARMGQVQILVMHEDIFKAMHKV